MTGLDIDNDVIIEIFCVITNGNLEVLDEEGWGAIIHQTKERMDEMVRLNTVPRNMLYSALAPSTADILWETG